MFINGFYDSRYRAVVAHLVERYRTSGFIRVVDDLHYPVEQTDPATDLRYSALVRGDYPIPPNVQDPLDGSTVREMADVEMTVLRMMDRLPGPPTYRERKARYLRHLRFWTHVVGRGLVRGMVSSNVPHEIHDYIAYEVIRRAGLPVVIFAQIPFLPGYSLPMSSISPFCPELGERYARLSRTGGDPTLAPEVEKRFLEQSGVDIPQPFYMKRSRRRMIGRVAGLLGSRRGLAQLWRRFGRIDRNVTRRRLERRRRRMSTPSAPAGPFLYLPLHFQPEMTTSPLAEVFVDQELMVHIVAAALPQGWHLVVKEHPRQEILRRHARFYETLLDHPQVVLIDERIPAQPLIDASIGIVTATGTTAWEGLFRGKPVLMFGQHIYRWAPGVFPVESRDDVIAIIDRLKTYTPDHRELRRFLAAVQETAVPATVDPVYWSQVDRQPAENSRVLIDRIDQEIG